MANYMRKMRVSEERRKIELSESVGLGWLTPNSWKQCKSEGDKSNFPLSDFHFSENVKNCINTTT